jgi:hypothetical protein
MKGSTMKKTFALTITAIALSLPALSSAQFANPLSGLMGSKSSGTSASADMGAQQDSLVRTYVAAGKSVLTANSQMTDALGIKAKSINDSATSDSLAAKDIEAQDKAISADSAALSEAFKSGATLKDEEAKAKYAQGLLSLAVGVKKYVDMSKEAQGFASSMATVSPLQMGKLQSGAYIAKSLPGNVTNLTSVLKSAIDFARNNGVPVPDDVNSVI